MKHLILIICLLCCSPSANAFWFSKDAELLDEAKERISNLETRLSAQTINVDNWRIAAGSLAVGCAFLLILGTALGSKTRNHHHHATSSRRMGGSPPSTPSLNGRKPNMGNATDQNVHSTLAA